MTSRRKPGGLGISRNLIRLGMLALLAPALAVHGAWLDGVFPDKSKDLDSLSDLSLAELSQVKIRIASVTDRPIREQPAIVSVITAEEIQATGAKDMKGVLSLVPGFSFGEDVDTAVGAGFRGLWAYEGKVLVLLDGIPVNDGLYGTVLFGDHYAADQIQKVEIIRGPGSARYGGNAELAVISITSKGAEQNGGFVSVRPEVVPGRAGVMANGSFGYQLTNDWRVSAAVSYEDFIRSDQRYVSLNGQVVDMESRSRVTPLLVNTSLGWRDLDLRFVFDNYVYDNPIGFGNPGLQTPGTLWGETFQSVLGSAKYTLHPASDVTFTPELTVTDQRPWWLQTSPGQGDFELEYRKINVDLPTVIEFNEYNQLMFGVTGYYERADAVQTSPFFGQAAPAVFFGGQDEVDYYDVAGYAQYDLDTRWANLTLGGRYETHNDVGGQFVPRVGVTRAWDHFHLKLLFDQAFRTPNVESIQQRLGGQSISYEKTTSYQLEAGYDFTRHLSTVANLFYARVENPLAFTTIDNVHFGYINGGPVSTWGGELELKYQTEKWRLDLSYSYYRAEDRLDQSLGLYASNVEGLNLALPAHKVALSSTLHLTRELDWNVSGTFNSPVRAIAWPGTETTLSATVDLNTYLEYHWGNFSAGVGVANLLNQSLQVGQAYNGGAAPLPLLGRSYFARLACRF